MIFDYNTGLKLNVMKKYNKAQVDNLFKAEILPSVKDRYEQDGIKDVPARCEAYNNLVDSLHKDGLLTDKQANTYSIPTYLI